MQSGESELDSIWLCLKKVAQPGQPIKLFTTNNTDPDEHYLWTLHRATAHRMWGREWVWRPGGWDAGGRPHILLVASEIGAPLDFLRVSAQAATPLLPQTSRSAIPALLLPFLRADASLERQRRARRVSWKGKHSERLQGFQLLP